MNDRIRRTRELGHEPPASEITDEAVYKARRTFMAGAAAVGLTGLPSVAAAASPQTALLPGVKKSSLSVTGEKTNAWEDATTYNNFYEFGTGKDEPAQNAHTLRPRPWTVELTGEVVRPRRVDLDALLTTLPLEERVYRMRCVEAWSMVIPWLGFPLSALLQQVEPTSAAKYVAFTTLFDPEQMPGQKKRVLDWPYVEALRLDEAMNPLTLMAVGLYGKSLPNQNGAPLRLVVPWKYGFKSIKSIVKIELTRDLPRTTWNLAAPGEYGFYANVNPEHPHPRWSQATEQRIGESGRRKTLMFNGYADQVASLYTGMNLDAHF